MESGADLSDVKPVAARMDAELRALPVRNTPNERAVCRRLFRELAPASPEFILALARELLLGYDHRWIAYELIESHPGAFQRLGQAELEELGRGIDSWWTVDSFARTLSGPAWLKRQVPDDLIHRWAGSEDRWWRRAALVSTVALNAPSHGGFGDVPRTLAVCRRLVDDHDDMVVKAMSWALRELLVFDPDAVRRFLAEHEVALAARVKREVRNKLDTGLKNPGRKKRSNES
jgi:3-methyladenine DNA glycosylase AlkD